MVVRLLRRPPVVIEGRVGSQLPQLLPKKLGS